MPPPRARDRVVVAFAVQLGVQLVLTFTAREHYLPPVVARFGVEQGAFVPGYPMDSGYSYQPESRDWPFHGIETAIVLVLAAGALGAGVWGLRTRVH